MGEMFSGCKRLEHIYMNRWGLNNELDGGNNIYVSRMFENCESIKKLPILEKFQGYSISEYYGMFKNCKRLETVNLKKFPFRYDVYKAGFNYMFENCENLKTVEFGEYSRNTLLFENMFKNCKSLTKLELCNVSSFLEDYKLCKLYVSSMFEDCINLEELNIEKMEFKNDTIISNDMFKNCNKLRKIICLEDSFNYFMNNKLLSGSWKWENYIAQRTDI
jgi:hypothetical protein